MIKFLKDFISRDIGDDTGLKIYDKDGILEYSDDTGFTKEFIDKYHDEICKNCDLNKKLKGELSCI